MIVGDFFGVAWSMGKFFIPFLAVRQNMYFPIHIVNDYFFAYPKLNIRGPFFYIENDDSVINFFLEAIFNSTVEEAKKFTSEGFESTYDLQTIKRFLMSDFNYKAWDYKYVTGNSVRYMDKNFFVRPVVFMEKDSCRGNVLDFYLVRQPDNFSYWKICAIE